MTLDEIRDKVLALELRAEKEEERHRGLDARLEALERTQAGILDLRLLIERLTMGNESSQKSFADLNARLDKLDAKLEERMTSLEKRIDTHEKEPGKKWEKLSWLVLSLVVGGAIGYFINMLTT